MDLCVPATAPVQEVWCVIERGFMQLAHPAGLDLQGWTRLYNFLFEVFCSERPTSDFEQIYQLMLLFFERLCASMRLQFVAAPDDCFLRAYLQSWVRYTEIAKNIRKVCGYMHRYFIPETGKTDLFVMALVKWREVCLSSVEERLYGAFLQLIQRRQNGPAASAVDDDELLMGLVSSFAGISVQERSGARLNEQRREALVERVSGALLAELAALPLTGQPHEDRRRLLQVLTRLPTNDEFLASLLRDQLFEETTAAASPVLS